MALVTEHLNGGLVTAREATELVPGELQQANECVYRLHDTAIYGRPGRTQYNNTIIKDASGANAAVKGLAHLPFANTRTDQVLAYGGNDNGNGALWFGDFTSISGAATFSRLTGPGQVADAVLNGTTTVTSASNGFTNMVQGARITGANIPNNTFVQTVNSPGNITITQAATSTGTITASFDMGIAVQPDDVGTEVLDLVQWGDNYYAIGAGVSQRVFYKKRSLQGTSLTDLFIGRAAGLDPVVVQPTVTRVAGTWPSILGNGFYWFVITEIIDPDQDDEVEGTYTPIDVHGTKLGPVSGQITDFTTQTFTITRGNIVNDGSRGRLATHWAVYMSPVSSDGTSIPSLAIFRRITTVPITSTSVTLTDTSTSANPTQVKYAGATAAQAGRTQFTNPGNMTGAPDNKVATAVTSGGVSPANRLQNFGFSTGAPFNTGTITGIRVTVYCFATKVAASGFNIQLQTTTGKISFPATKGVTNKYQAVSIGDQFDTWGVAWTPADFADGIFEVFIEKFNSPIGDQLNVDSVQVTVFYSGGSINLNGRPFRVVTYRDAIGFTIDEPARLPPPIATTCTIFQGSIVSNDLSNRTTIKWSLPGEPEAWPRPYVLSFYGGKSDTVTCVRRLNQILVVGMRESVHRVNYLPSEVDTDFKEGLSHEAITEDHGIVGSLAAALFTRTLPPMVMSYMRYSGGTHLAFVSLTNLMVTDGVTTTFLNTDIRISDFVDPNYIQNCVLRNYPKEQWLVLFYTPIGGTRNTKALIFTYDQPKQDGTLRCIGPISVNARSAASATLNGKPILLTGHQVGGTIWTEDQGDSVAGYTLDGSTQLSAPPAIITRRFYPAGIDRNARIEKEYIQHVATGSTIAIANAVMTAGNAVVTCATGWGSVTAGMRAVHANIPGDAVVVSVVGNNLTLSQPAYDNLTDTVTFDTGTISISLRVQSIGTTITKSATTYSSTLTGGILSTSQDAHAQAFDMMIEKVRMPDDSMLDLNTAMRLNHFTYEINDGGKEQSRTGAL